MDLENAWNYDKECNFFFWNGHARDFLLCPLHEYFKTTGCFGMEYFVLSHENLKKKYGCIVNMA